MKKNALLCWAVLAGLLVSARVEAQLVYGERTIGFEKDCSGAATPGAFDQPLIIGGYKTLDDAFFENCGVSAVTSGGGTGNQQLHRPASQLIPGTLDGMDGDVALAGTFILADGSFSMGSLTIRFNPPVNELSFKVLSLDNASGLTVSLFEAGGNPITTPQPTVANQKTTFNYTSPGPNYTPVGRVVISYTPTGILDGWFVDTLKFNAWHCGDSDPEPNEQCDDGDNVQCDGCGNDCKTTIDGCLSGTSCVPAGTVAGSFGCATCVVPTPGTGALELAPTNQTCSSGNFCVVGETCSDNTGVCEGSSRDCSDNVDCTDDACSEAQDQCTHAIKQGSCLIDGTCFTNGEGNINDPCERCDRSLANNAWSLKPQGARCGDPSCMDGIVTPYPRCSAGGLCETQTPMSCQGAVCADSISCDGACTGDNDCVEATHCVAGVCEPDLPNGEPCERASQCNSNFCVDGVCCGDICNGACVSCDLDGKVGMCSPQAGGTDPDNDCPDAQFCGGNGKCVGENRPDGSDCESAEVCASGFCADGVCCNAACDRSCEACDLLDSLGMCTPYLAGTDPDMECPNAQLCSAPGVCAPENRPNGTECSADAYCASGHCADGVCCDMACDGMCEACNSADQVGVCIAFAAGTDPNNECSGDAVCSGERSCVSYETRGNGLCSLRHGQRPSIWILASLLALGALLRARRRAKR